MSELTANLDEPCYSLRDFLAVASAARGARKPLGEVIDALLDLASDG